jgi:hypothetical protein
MKKTVLIFIAAISILAVMAVSFFGTMPIGINPTVYIDSVEILDMNLNPIEDKSEEGDKILRLDFDWDGAQKDSQGVLYMTYIFNTTVLPDNCTKRRFSYSCPENNYVKSINSSAGIFSIREMRYGFGESPYFICDIKCQAADGGPGQVEDNLKLIVKYGEGIVF